MQTTKLLCIRFDQIATNISIYLSIVYSVILVSLLDYYILC